LTGGAFLYHDIVLIYSHRKFPGCNFLELSYPGKSNPHPYCKGEILSTDGGIVKFKAQEDDFCSE
jgi:hypothetical protein